MEILLWAGSKIIGVGLADVNIVASPDTAVHVFISHQGPLAVRAVDQLSENIGCCTQSVIFSLSRMIGAFGVLCHPLNRLKGFFIHQRFMGIADDNPLGFWYTAGLSALRKPGAFPSLHHMTQVNLAGQYVFNGAYVPNRVGISFGF